MITTTTITTITTITTAVSPRSTEKQWRWLEQNDVCNLGGFLCSTIANGGFRRPQDPLETSQSGQPNPQDGLPNLPEIPFAFRSPTRQAERAQFRQQRQERKRKL